MINPSKERQTGPGKPKGVLWIGVAIALLLLILHPPMAVHSQAVTSQSVASLAKDQDSFRLSQLETEVRGLRSQIRHLESQLNQRDRPTSTASIPSLPRSPLPSDPELSQPEPDLMFDQLATLVIETRQDMLRLQDQVTQLEQAMAANQAP